MLTILLSDIWTYHINRHSPLPLFILDLTKLSAKLRGRLNETNDSLYILCVIQILQHRPPGFNSLLRTIQNAG